MKHDKKKQWLSIGLLTLGAAALAVFAAATLDAGDVRSSLAALCAEWVGRSPPSRRTCPASHRAVLYFSS